jgi:C4-dicarboxylate transporter, DctM subunit
VSGLWVGVLGFAGLMVLMALRVPIAVAMIVTALAGYAALAGLAPLLAHLKTAPYALFSGYSLSVIPLFVLMGMFASEAGMSAALFRAADAWLGRRKGGLAMATIVGCAAFGAICGSSVATAATMAQVALPEMRRYGYSGALSTGTLAVGGTLGILIPPSVILVVYGLICEQNIAKLFAAAVVPGLLATAGYLVAVAVYVRRNPAAAPATAASTAAERRRGLVEVWPVAAIFVVVVGGLYGGVFTPTEGAAVGAFSTFLLAVAKRALGWARMKRALLLTAETSGMIFLILLGADLFNSFLALSHLPDALARAIVGLELPPYAVMLAILAIYILLGCVMDELSMILLTLPILFPIVMGLDFGLPRAEVGIWFGILVLTVVGVGLVAPPVGLNVYVISGMARDVPMSETFRGVLPYLCADAVRIAYLVAFPSVSLWLVRLLG